MKYFVLKCYFSIQDFQEEDYDLSSSFRGLWGRNLKRIFCLQRNIECKDCTFDSCVYYSIFEKKYGDNDEYRPYIVYHNKDNESEIEIHYIFLGFLCNHSEKMLIPIMQMHQQFLYSKGEKYLLNISRIEDEKGQVVFNQKQTNFDRIAISKIEPSEQYASKISINFITPLRMKYQNNLMKTFNFEAFVKSLIRRTTFINTYFNDDEETVPQFDEDMLNCEIQNQFRWIEKYRKSLRQNQRMSIGGLIGSIEITNPHPKLLYLLKIGQLVQAGKQTSFGNGRYHLNVDI